MSREKEENDIILEKVFDRDQREAGTRTQGRRLDPKCSQVGNCHKGPEKSHPMVINGLRKL